MRSKGIFRRFGVCWGGSRVGGRFEVKRYSEGCRGRGGWFRRGEPCLRLVFPVEIPAEAVEDGLEELAAINVNHSAFAGEKTLDISGAVGGELVGGSMSFAAGAMTRHDETRVDHSTDKRHTFVGKLGTAFVRV